MISVMRRGVVAVVLCVLAGEEAVAQVRIPVDLAAGVEAGSYPTSNQDRTLYGGGAAEIDVGWWDPGIWARFLLRAQAYSHGAGENSSCESSRGGLFDASFGSRLTIVQGERLRAFFSPTVGVAVLTIHGTAGCTGEDGTRVAPVVTAALGLDVRLTEWLAIRSEGRVGLLLRDIDIGGGIQSLELGGSVSLVLLRR